MSLSKPERMDALLIAQNEFAELKLAGPDTANTVHYCPACTEPVIYRSGPNTMPHFAHRKNSICLTTSEPESPAHLAGKMALYESMITENPDVYLEKVIPAIKQRADIYLIHGRRHYAIEFQCSKLSMATFRKRSAGYSAQGIKPIWIFHHNLVRHLKSGLWQLPGLVQMAINEKAQLLTFDPPTNQLYAFSQLVPMTANHFFAHVTMSPKAQITLNKLVMPAEGRSPFHLVWMKIRKHHIYFRPRLEGLRVPFYRRLYQTGYHLTMLPAFVGIPLQSGFLIRTPALEWQGSLFLELVQRKQISVMEVEQLLQKFIDEKEIKPANLPLVRQLTPMNAVNEFLRVLCFCRFLSPNGRQGYDIHTERMKDVDVVGLVRFLQGEVRPNKWH